MNIKIDQPIIDINVKASRHSARGMNEPLSF